MVSSGFLRVLASIGNMCDLLHFRTDVREPFTQNNYPILLIFLTPRGGPEVCFEGMRVPELSPLQMY